MAVAGLLIRGAGGRSRPPAGGTAGLCTDRNRATTRCGTTTRVSSKRKAAVAPNLARQVNATNRHTGNDLAVTSSGFGALAAGGNPHQRRALAAWPGGDEPAHAAMAYAFVVYHWAKLVGTTGDMFGARGCLLPSACKSFDNRASARTLLADQQRLAGSPGAAPAAQIALGSEISARESELLGKALEAMPGRMRAGL